MTLNTHKTAIRNKHADAYADELDVGTTDASGDLQIWTAGFGTLLAELTFSNPAGGAASAGTVTFNAVTKDSSANASGTAAVARWRDRDNGTCFEGTVGTSGADIILNTVTITAGDDVSMAGPNTISGAA